MMRGFNHEPTRTNTNKGKVLFLMFAVFLALSSCTNFFMERLFVSEKISYTVSFESNGGSPVPSQTVRKGEKATRPDNPTKVEDDFEYGFVNWYDNEELSEPHYNFDTPVTADITLYAKWSDTVYIVTFDSNGGSEIPIQRVGEDGTASRPPNPTKDGCTFGGWYLDEDCTEAYDFDTPVTGDITLYAQWTGNTADISITVEQMTDLSFDDIDGGIIYRNANPSSVNLEYTDTGDYTCEWTIDGVGAYAGLITLSDTASCTVDATNPRYNSIGKHAVYLTVVKNDVPYKKAIWVTIMGGDIYTVSFDTNGGSIVPSQQIVEGTRATRPDNPTMDGFGFVDWYDNAGLTGSHYDFNTPVTGNITLYAKWNSNFYTVTFNSNGGSIVPSQLVVEGGTASRPMSNPTKEDYAFGGWYGDSALTALYDFDTPVTGTITLYARWLAFFTVSFNTDGGSPTPVPQNIIEGGKASRPQNPTKADLSFENWYSNSALTVLYNFNTPVNGNITLYAKWVTYNEADFGAGATISNTFNVANRTQWDDAKTTISGGGSNKNYIINVTANFTATGSTASTFGGAKGIKVSLRGAGMTITLSGNGNLIRIGDNQTVILRDLTLQGHASNNNSVVHLSGVTVGAFFVMHSGKISGNNNDGGGGGVYVNNRSTFTMYGGEISGNTISTGSYGGGGVFLNGSTNVGTATFTMNGGIISGNTVTNSYGGGGVYMTSVSVFTMNGGIISGNTSVDGGGGVRMSSATATFTMNGGEISGNTTNNNNGGGVSTIGGTVTMNGGEISGNTASNSGGGVAVTGANSTFTMNGGKIFGNTASGTGNNGGGGVHVNNNATFTMNGGEISGNTATNNNGGGVYLYTTGTFRIVTGTIYGSNEADTILKNSAATSGAALFRNTSTSNTAERGTFSGATWNSSGDLVTTEDTIRVQNGEMQ